MSSRVNRYRCVCMRIICKVLKLDYVFLCATKNKNCQSLVDFLNFFLTILTFHMTFCSLLLLTPYLQSESIFPIDKLREINNLCLGFFDKITIEYS